MDARRAARRDLGSVSDADAACWIAEARPATEAEIRRLAWLCNAAVDEEDLRAVAHVAILEAHLSYRPGRCSLRTWVGKLIRWRLTEAVQAEQRPEEPLEQPVVNGRSPEEIVEATERAGWLQSAIGKLGPRHRTIVAARLRGEVTRHTGMTLGISGGRVRQELEVATAALAQAALDEGVTDE